MIYDERMKMVLWDYVPSKKSKKDIKEAMYINLGKKKHKTIKKLNFSINEPYEKEIIGYGPYKEDTEYTLIPNFVGYSQSVAQSIANRYGIKVRFIGSGGTVVSQSGKANQRIDKAGTITLTLSGTQQQKQQTTEVKEEVKTTPCDTDPNSTACACYKDKTSKECVCGSDPTNPQCKSSVEGEEEEDIP